VIEKRIEIFDEETGRLAQLAKAADLDGDGIVTPEELAQKYYNYSSGSQKRFHTLTLRLNPQRVRLNAKRGETRKREQPNHFCHGEGADVAMSVTWKVRR
jgi:hypothetical protein